MSFLNKFKAGFDIGTKEKVNHPLSLKHGKDVYKSSTKWEKKNAKEEKKARKRNNIY